MEFISARDAVLFLSQSAPAAWVCRALLWMAQAGELDLYADKVEVVARAHVFGFIAPLFEQAGEWEGDSMNEAIRKTYGPDLAQKIIGAEKFEYIDEELQVIEGCESIGAIPLGFLVFCSKFDWKSSQMDCDFIDDDMLRIDRLFWNQDFVRSDFPKADYTVKFSGMKFEANRIELLLPSAQFSASVEKGTGTTNPRHIGRPRQWDWDGAFAHIVAKAQTPDGLPTGHGAQAKVEAMIAAWFEDQTGNSPAISQIRSKASRIMGMIEKD
jgi:hypothetical protein